MFERRKTFRTEAESETHPASGPPRTDLRDDGLTRAQARAMSRCAPLTPAEFKQRRRAAEQGLVSLSTLLEDGTEARKR